VLFITHDLSLLLEIADRVVIMYAGQIVESGTREQIHLRAAHPYTRGLLTSFPKLHGPRVKLSGIPGSPPNLREKLTGCAFIPRCGFATDACATVDMALAPIEPEPDHLTACPFVNAAQQAAPTPPAPSEDRRPADTGQVVLEAVDLEKRFRLGRGRKATDVAAVNHVSLKLREGTVTALVGESGSGKTTVARLLAGQEGRSGGRILLDGQPIEPASKRGFRAYKGVVQMVFQDPFASLNPLHTVSYHLTRALRLHASQSGREPSQDELDKLLEQVRLTPAGHFRDAYPHELSGGQRQRVAIARSLAAAPRVLLADEPVSMLDVSIRLEMLDLIDQLRRNLDLAVLYITHDIASARYFADEILVMYAGEIVERGPAELLTHAPSHEYTRLLIASAPDPDAFGRQLPARREDRAMR
jgi:peptide/nickel transport system ATP-binding protein